ncbi:MAG: Ni/Fe-hydrogenase, b-type cytochrome subunit [Aromatoleum sp.]|nr:Ni/Fe-hydrogenase, b-type cytochrome subunit [Aromatoleum sp.]
MRVEPVSGRVISGPLEDVYVYEAPVRLWHWVTMLCIIALGVTGYFIGSPPPAIGGEAYDHFLFGWIRMVHESAGVILVVAFLVRIYWAVMGNHHARSIFYVPLWSGEWWKALKDQGLYSLFLKRESQLWVGHDPIAQASMFFMFTLGALFLCVTGLALFAEQWGWGTYWMMWFGWVFVLFGDPQMVRTLHHLAMWYMVLFAFIHIYMVFREDIMSGGSVIGTMVNGIRMFKREPRA